MLNKNMVQKIVENALLEDMGTGDITTISTIPEDVEIGGRFIAKADGVVCGLDVVRTVFHTIDENVEFTTNIKDGDIVKTGDVFAEVKGNAQAILQGERVALNFLQRMSGIATYTKKVSDEVKDFKTKIIDTRKTIPGLRILDKYAVRMGEGHNHRHNLSDGVLIKDNHISASGSITTAVENARKIVPHTIKIEVEVKNFDEVNEALAVGADIIMLDNMTTEEMTEAVNMINGKALVEASGNMDQKSLPEIAATGVDFISMGALTHSVKALDISLRF
jgi:nicotinate-nucleotide pyrophosphorylase (carboxylating)